MDNTQIELIHEAERLQAAPVEKKTNANVTCGDCAEKPRDLTADVMNAVEFAWVQKRK